VPINFNNLRRTDLNLLPVFLALMQERSITRAAARVYLGQPATSAALKRLRILFRDDLLVRAAGGMEPTDRALALAQQVEALLAGLESALSEAGSFDPAHEQRVFRLGMPDNHQHFLLPPLLALLQHEAPGIRLAVSTANGYTAPKMLDEGEIELACGRIDAVRAWQRRQPLASVGLKTIFDRRQVGFKAPVTLSRFLEFPHLLVSFWGDMEGTLDEALARDGKKRRVILATDSFSVLPVILKEVAAFATLPALAAERFAADYRLEVCDPPIRLPRYSVSLAWLAKTDRDPAHLWLRDAIRRALPGAQKASPARSGRAGAERRPGPRTRRGSSR